VRVRPTNLPGVLLIEPPVFRDERGHFLESYAEERYRKAGVEERFVQDNVSFSRGGVLRGLHYQHPHGQAKLVGVLAGAVYDVVVDVRRGSPTFGGWEGYRLDAETGRQLFVPAGFAHGFQVLGESALFSYKCSEYYRPDSEGAVLWNDPDLGIAWPLPAARLSPKDAAAPRLRDVPPDRLPEY
jgi:dTDP-4-dehydrorhamnose 3,5-epimerase